MGGACVSDYILKQFIFENNSNMKENYYHNNIQQRDNNKITKKEFHIMSNLLEKDQDKKATNKRYSDFQSLGIANREKELKYMNINNKVSNIEGKNTSCNDTCLLNNLTNNNDESNPKLYSNFNSSNYNGGMFSPALPDKKKDLYLTSEEKKMNLDDNNMINHNVNNNNFNHDKHNNVIKKIKENEEDIKNSDTNINLGGNNVIFINISRGSAIIHTPHQNHEIDNFESTTPKMIVDKENLDETDKGDLKMFSHFSKRIKTHKEKKKDNQVVKNEFILIFDMNKYSEEMLNIINSIRTNPKSFIRDIDYIINNSIQKNDEGVFLISYDKEEKIKLMDNYIEIIDHAKEILSQVNNSPDSLDKLEKLEYNDDLEILFDESNYEDVYPDIDIKDLPSKLNIIYDENGVDEYVDMENDSDTLLFEYNENVNLIDFDSEIEKKEKEICNNKSYNTNANTNDNINNPININNNEESNKSNKIKYKKKKKNINCCLDLNDNKIANLILHKRKEIKNKYPNNIFKISVIKDIRLNILAQIAIEEYFKERNKKTLLEIIFDSKYKYFAVGWTKEINRNFLSIYCFA